MSDIVDRKLYKYMSFHSYVDLVQSKSLNFVRPCVWDDPYEGFIFQKLKTEKGKSEIRKLIESIPDNLVKGIFIDLALRFEKIFYAQSWSLCAESDAMWRIYNFDNTTVRIEVLESQIQKVTDIKILDVEYDAEINLEKEIKKICLHENKTKFMEIFRIKRMAFAHEKEVRLIYQKNDAINEKSDEEKKVFENALRGTDLEHILTNINDSYSNFQKIDFSYIPNFINSVCLHPQAPDWFNLTLEEFCRLNSQNYLGKSKLYEAI